MVDQGPIPDQAIDSQKSRLLASRLLSFLKPDQILEPKSESDLQWGLDWTRFAQPHPILVVFPTSTQDVSQILKLCSELKVSVVPSGGRTGLAGGAVAAHGELVLNLSRMNRIGTLDALAQMIRVDAGVVHEELQNHLKNTGLYWPIDLASKGSCQIGGNLATNAGGLRVVRYGHVRNWVASLEAVLMDGRVVELGLEVEKNNTGYDLKNLVIGSEGTLAVVTAATLKLAPLPGESVVLLNRFDSIHNALEFLSAIKKKHLPFLGVEFWSEACLDVVCARQGFEKPFAERAPWTLLLEIEATPTTWAWLEEESEKSLSGSVVATENEAKRRLWNYRERITESLSQLGLVYKNDLALPLGRMESFLTEVNAASARWYPGCSVYLFGHLGDGNVHVNVVQPKDSPRSAQDFLHLCEQSNTPLFELVQKYKGSIAAEHGIGLLKRDFLKYSKSDVEIELLKRIKTSWDPLGLLNPGKIFPQ